MNTYKHKQALERCLSMLEMIDGMNKRIENGERLKKFGMFDYSKTVDRENAIRKAGILRLQESYFKTLKSIAQ